MLLRFMSESPEMHERCRSPDPTPKVGCTKAEGSWDLYFKNILFFIF